MAVKQHCKQVFSDDMFKLRVRIDAFHIHQADRNLEHKLAGVALNKGTNCLERE